MKHAPLGEVEVQANVATEWIECSLDGNELDEIFHPVIAEVLK